VPEPRCFDRQAPSASKQYETRGVQSTNRVALAALAAASITFAGAANAQQDFSKVEIKTTDLGNKTYMLEGAGGNITVAVGTDGIIMVDTQFTPLHDKIMAAVRAISPLPIKYIINTHFHGDHTGGDAAFQKDGTIVIAQDNIRLRLAGGTTNGTTGNKTAPVSGDARPSKSAAARRCSITSTTPIPTAIPGSISRTPT
jgi:cyclase